MTEEKKYPEGHFVSLWIAVGIAIFSGVGVSLAIATKNYGLLGVGPALGAAMGIAIGQSVEQKKKAEGLIRPSTTREQQQRKILIWTLILLGVLGFIAFFFLLKGVDI